MTSLAIGPANYAGQAYAWAAAARAHLDIDSYSFSFRTLPSFLGRGAAFSFPSDRRLPHPRIATPIGRRLRRRSIAVSSHVMLDGFLPLGRHPSGGIEADVRYLSDRSKAVALISHGSDLRHPDHHRDLFKHSYFNYAQAEWTDLMRDRVERNEATLSRFPDVPLFVSTPDLMLHQPGAAWLPLCVDKRLFTAHVDDPLERVTPIVLHIPSRRHPPIKGTHFIDPLLKRLEAQGALRYISPKSVSHHEMLRLIASADVVIDQILTGSYGVTAVEAMALGRVVIGGVSEEVRATLPDNPPIVDATPEDLESVIKSVIGNRARFAAIATEGRVFSKTWHDGRASAAIIGGWFEQ